MTESGAFRPTRGIGAVVIAALAGLLAIGVWEFRAEHEARRLSVEQELASIGRLKIDRLAAWRAERLADAAVLAESGAGNGRLRRFLEDRSPEATRAALALLRSHQTTQGYVDAVVLGPGGAWLLSASGDTSRYRITEASWAEGMAARKPFIAEVHVEAPGAPTWFAAAAPIYPAGAADGSPVAGAVFLVIDPTRVLYPMLQLWPRPSLTAETTLSRRDGGDVLFLNDVRHQPGSAFKLRVALSRTDVPAVAGALGREGVFRGQDYRGVEVLAVVLRVPDSPWIVVAKADVEEIFREWRLQAYRLVALVLALAGVILAGAAVVQHRRRAQHYADLYAATEALRASDERFRGAFHDHAASQLLIEAETGRIVEANPAAAAWYGWSREELGAMRVQDINTLPPEEVKARLERAKALGSAVYEVRHRRADGSARDVMILAGMVEVQGRSLLHAIVLDVTDRKDAEERAKRAELRKTDSLERMAGGIAHRYNNLLQVVIGNLELASHDVPEGSEPALALEVAMEAARRASDMGGMMLVYLGQTAARRAAVDLSRVCRESIAELGAGVGETARVEADLPEAGPVVQASVDQLRQVLRILLANAWEALGGGAGVVSVRVRQLPAADLPAEGCHPEGFEPEAPEYACIEVADTGVGIPSEAMDQLFDPFYTTKFAGRGLGLSVALGIVRGHAGCIAVERGVPCGSVLRVFLPLRAEAPLATAPDREGVA